MNIMEQPNNQPQKPTDPPAIPVATAPAEQPVKSNNNTMGTLIMILVGAWILSGLIAFIYSLYCFSKSGTTGEKILGLLLSMLIGPFYFIYVYVSGSYCK
jgi:uncharacterized membrane-anchored protein